MRNMLIAFIAALISIVIVLTGFTIHGRSIRQIELDNALKSSMEEAMASLMYEEGRPESEEEWKATLVQSLAIQINSASDLQVEIIEADMERGLLSVEATLIWRHPIGTQGSVSSLMTVIMEEYEE